MMLAAVRTKSRRETAFLVLFSGIVHVGLLVLSMQSFSAIRSPPSYSDGNSGAIAVSLISVRSTAQGSVEPAQTAPDSFADLQRQLKREATRGEAPPSSIAKGNSSSQKANLEQLFGKRIQAASAVAPAAAEPAAPVQSGAGAGDGNGLASIPRSAPGGVKAGHCWRPSKDRFPAEVLITVSDQGLVAGAPNIKVRGGGSDPSVTLKAMQALAPCAPFSALTPGRYHLVRLDFDNPSRWETDAGVRDVH